jgi:hypothetical protein
MRGAGSYYEDFFRLAQIDGSVCLSVLSEKYCINLKMPI